VKTDRSTSASARAAALLLAGLLAAGLPAAGQTFTFRLGKSKARKDSSKVSAASLAGALAEQVNEVQKTFDTNRRALRAVRGPGGVSAYPRQDVAYLIDHTGQDLDQAIRHVRPAGLEPLIDWSDDKLRGIQGELAGPHGKTAASSPGFSTPRAVAVLASLGPLTLTELASVNAAPQPETLPADTSNRLLDQVGEVIGRIFFLASHDDLEVKLWAGSTPAPGAKLRFWPQGGIKGSPPEATIIRTDGKQDHVLRGLYAYRATWAADGAVTEVVEYPSPAAAQIPSERLDLVNGSSFFCCRFNENYCQHVADEKECRP